MIRRPGFYGGFGYGWESGWGLDLRTGYYRSGPSFDDLQLRADFAGRVPITKQLALRAGGALLEPAKITPNTFDYELSVGPTLSF